MYFLFRPHLNQSWFVGPTGRDVFPLSFRDLGLNSLYWVNIAIISHIKTKNWNQDTEIDKRVSKSDIQQGEVECSPGKGPNTDTVQVFFPQRYSKAPRVFLSVRLIEGNADHNPDGSYTDDDTGTEYYIEAQSVTQTGFRLRCEVFTYSYIKTMSVYWIAFASP